MVSPILLSWQHNDYTCHLTHYIWNHSHCICDVTPALLMTSQVWKSSQLAYVWHNKHSTWHHIQFMTSIIIIYDITTTAFMTSDLLYMTSHPRFMTSHPLYLWHHSHSIWNITPTMWIHINYIWDQTHCVKTIQPLYLTSHPPYLYLCDHTHSLGDITHTVCMISYILYVWHNMQYIWNHTHALWHHSTLFMISNLIYLTSHPLYLTAHPLYVCNHTQIIDPIIPTVCMISQPQYIWHLMNCRWHHIHSLWYHTTLWHHTPCIHVIKPSIFDIASTVAVSLLTVHWLYHARNMCDIKPTICMTSCEFNVKSHPFFMTSQDCIHDITSTLFMISHPLYMTSHTLYLWHYSPYNYEKTPAMFLR